MPAVVQRRRKAKLSSSEDWTTVQAHPAAGVDHDELGAEMPAVAQRRLRQAKLSSRSRENSEDWTTVQAHPAAGVDHDHEPGAEHPRRTSLVDVSAVSDTWSDTWSDATSQMATKRRSPHTRSARPTFDPEDAPLPERTRVTQQAGPLAESRASPLVCGAHVLMHVHSQGLQTECGQPRKSRITAGCDTG